MSDSLRPHEPQHARPPCPPPTPGVHRNPRQLSRWCHPTISSSVIPFSSQFQSFPASGSFQIRHFFASSGQSMGVSASASVLPNNIQDWFRLGWTGWISLQSKGLSRVFPNTTVQKHQFFSAPLSLWRRQWQPTPVLLPGKSHGRRSLLGYSPWGHKESDQTHLCCVLGLCHSLKICALPAPFPPVTVGWHHWLNEHEFEQIPGDSNGTPLQYSCLENPMDGGAC